MCCLVFGDFRWTGFHEMKWCCLQSDEGAVLAMMLGERGITGNGQCICGSS